MSRNPAAARPRRKPPPGPEVAPQCTAPRRARAVALEPAFASRIIAWQRAHGRHDLPWQQTRDPYRIWLSEVMLQQTQVATVIPYYNRFLASFPDVRSLAAAPIDRVLEHWAGLGYYRRAHHLHAAATALVEHHGGAFPRDVDALAELPGIGRSTAAAIAAFAFGARAAILEGNVKRVLARHQGIDGYPGEPRVATRLWALARALLPERGVEVYTQGMMDLGAAVCMRTKPRCAECPVARDCVARASGRTDSLPASRPQRQRPQRATRVLIIERAGEILFERRPATGIWGGLLSLPEIEVDDDARLAMRTRFGVEAVPGETLAPLTHGFTHFTLTLHPQRVGVPRWPARAESPALTWLTPAEAEHAALPAPIRVILRGL